MALLRGGREIVEEIALILKEIAQNSEENQEDTMLLSEN